MPTNVTPEYKNAEQRYRAAQTPEDQLDALEDMLSTVPKHKGTEKLQADIKRKISALRKETQQRRRARGHRPAHIIDRAEGGQTVLVGPPNGGKSALLARLTNATPDVADYPFTTQSPVPGMMPFENVRLQLIDLPALDADTTEPWVFEAVKRADLILLVVDAGSDDVLSEYEGARRALASRRIELAAPPSDPGRAEKAALVVANKLDVLGARENLALLRDLVAGDLPIVPTSAASGEGLEELRRSVFRALGIVRVYTKAPGRAGERTSPFMLPRGSTVMDAARTVHHDFADTLKYARIWGSERFEGQKVSRDHVLADEDMVEFHA